MIKTETVSVSTLICPECGGKKCDFCNNKGEIYYLPSKNAMDHIDIARAKYRIKQKSKG